MSPAPGQRFDFLVHTQICETATATARQFDEATAKPEAFGRAPAAAAPAGARVLLAEDNKINQLVGMRQLQKLGYKADVAGNGIEAVEAWKRNQYSIILMDCQMPEMDGFEAARKIRELEAEKNLAHVQIIALTASVMKEDRDRCLTAGMDDYISKPVGMDELKGALDKAAALRTNA